MCKECRSNPCRPQCPNYLDSPLMYCSICNKGIFAEDEYYEITGEIYCEDCVYDCRRVADSEAIEDNDGQPIFSYGDEWED